MDDNQWIPEGDFKKFVEQMPQVCVEVVVQTENGVLLAKRTNAPGKDEWFWPGGRLYKGERLTDAVHRIAREELDIDVDIEERLGVEEHFWERSSLPGEPSRHTVNVVYRVSPSEPPVDVSLDEQHADYRFVSEIESSLHEYVRRYIERYDLLSAKS